MKVQYTTTAPNGETITVESDRKPSPFALIWHGREGETQPPSVSSTHKREDLVLTEMKRWFGMESNKGIRLTVGKLV